MFNGKDGGLPLIVTHLRALDSHCYSRCWQRRQMKHAVDPVLIFSIAERGKRARALPNEGTRTKTTRPTASAPTTTPPSTRGSTPSPHTRRKPPPLPTDGPGLAIPPARYNAPDCMAQDRQTKA